MNFALKRDVADVGNFAELSAGLCWKLDERIAMLWAYFDESGKHGPSGELLELTIGGLIASQAAWRALEVEWNAALATAGLREFHGRVFLPAGVEQFVRIIGRHIRLGLGFTAVSVETARAYETAFVDCLLQVANLSGTGEPLSVVFAKHPEFRPGRARRFWEIVNVDDARLGSVSFADPAGMPQLQAADLVARLIGRGDAGPLREVGCRIAQFTNGRLVEWNG